MSETEDGAEPDVLAFHFAVAPALRGGKKLAEMHLLAAIDDIDHALRLELVVAVADGGEVGGGVDVTAVGFADEERVVAKSPVLGDEKRIVLGRELAVGEDGDRAFAFAGDEVPEQVGDDGGQGVVVKTFAEGVVELDAEPLVDDVERVEGEFAELFPELEVLGIALLELDEFGLGGIADGFVGFRLELDFLVDLFEVAEGIEPELLGIALAFVAEEDHAEASAPVAEVIVGDDGVAEEAVDAREGVAENGAAEMSDVHFLGDVRAAVIEDDGLGFGDGGNAEPGVAPALGDLVGEILGLEAEVDEAGAGHFGFFGDVLDVHDLGQVAGQFRRVGLHDFAEDERDVGLEIAVPGIGAWAHIRRGRRGREKFADGAGDAGFEFLAGGVHLGGSDFSGCGIEKQ